MLSAKIVQVVQVLKETIPPFFLDKLRGYAKDGYNRDKEATELLNDLTEPLNSTYHKAIDVSKYPHYKGCTI